MHALYQILEDIGRTLKRKDSKKITNFSWRLRHRVTTFIAVDFAWIFFASSSLKHALKMIRQMMLNAYTTGILSLGLDLRNWIVLLVGMVILLTVDGFRETGKSVYCFVNKQEIWFRWAIYLTLIWTVIMFGIYGAAYDDRSFIYFQF